MHISTTHAALILHIMLYETSQVSFTEMPDRILRSCLLLSTEAEQSKPVAVLNPRPKFLMCLADEAYQFKLAVSWSQMVFQNEKIN